MGGGAPAPTLQPGAQVAGYVVAERIGIGGFGEVFRAKHPLIAREVAIKVLHARYSADPQAVGRFIAEARAVNQISHAGIVEIFDFGELEDGREFYVMELLAGSTLRELLATEGKVPLAKALPILRGVAEAVDAAHAAGFAHRDLKPDNVFVLADGGTKLIDFGLAKLTREQASSVTQTGSIFGTPMYMSPEQCRGTAVDTRTDLYSFGVLAYHVLTGEPPFGGDPIELALHHVNDRPEPPSKRCPELPRYVDHVLLALLAKDPSDRPASLGTAVSALEGSITLRQRRSRRARQVMLGLVLCGGAGVAALQLAGGHETATDCPPARARLTGVWEASIRDPLAERFLASDRAYVRSAWMATSAALDKVASRWSAQWDEACHADDRSTDALLHAQRLTCLETQFLELRARVAEIGTQGTAEELKTLGVFPTYGRSLEDCQAPDVLRSQVSATPPAVRDYVTQLLLDAYRAYAEGIRAASERASLDDALARLEAITKEIEAVDPPRAALPILFRTDLLVGVTWDVASRLPRARAAIRDAIPRIEATHDDVMMTDIYLLEAGFEIEAERDVDALDRGRAALAKAERASERAGHPKRQTMELVALQGDLSRASGQHERASTAFRDVVRGTPEEDSSSYRVALAVELALAGSQQEALDEVARRGAILQRYDEDEAPSTEKLEAQVREYGGDLEGALRAIQRADARRATLDPPAYQNAWGDVWRTDLELRAGRLTDDAATSRALATIHALATLGTTPPKQNSDGPSTARRAGHFAAFAFAAEHELGSGTDAAIDNAAILAFQRGDLEAAAALGAKVAERCAKPSSCADWVRTGRWLALLPTAPTLAGLDALDREYGGDRSAVANSGILLASLGRWKEARVRLEAARALPDVWERHSDLVEIDTWLALARMQHGDTVGARRLFGEAIEIIAEWRNGFDGFSYMTPVAELELAKLVWNENDHARARRLAERARDGFARLGTHRDARRQEAVAWLEAHPG